MTLKQTTKVIWMAAATLLLLCGLSPPVVAEAWFAVHQANGHDWLYTLDEIEGITFGLDELYVRTALRTDTYSLSSIVRIEFISNGATVGVDGPGGGPIPVAPFYLFQNYPNPFSPETRIGFELPSAGRAELRIYDVSGRLIRSLVNEKLPAGPYSVSWDGHDDSGRAVASGVYFYSLTAPGVDENRRMILVK